VPADGLEANMRDVDGANGTYLDPLYSGGVHEERTHNLRRGKTFLGKSTNTTAQPLLSKDRHKHVIDVKLASELQRDQSKAQQQVGSAYETPQHNIDDAHDYGNGSSTKVKSPGTHKRKNANTTAQPLLSKDPHKHVIDVKLASELQRDQSKAQQQVASASETPQHNFDDAYDYGNGSSTKVKLLGAHKRKNTNTTAQPLLSKDRHKHVIDVKLASELQRDHSKAQQQVGSAYETPQHNFEDAHDYGNGSSTKVKSPGMHKLQKVTSGYWDSNNSQTPQGTHHVVTVKLASELQSASNMSES